MEFFFFWVVLSILVGALAASKGRSGIGYFFLSIILSPLLGLIIALVSGSNEKQLEVDEFERGELKKCSFCAELIKLQAVVCRHCGRDLPKPEKQEEPTIP